MRVVMVMVMMRAAAGGPGFNGNEDKAGEKQNEGGGVQRLVEGKGVVDGGWGGQVGRC